jgi:2-methylaconitate cis-trans-isomerase PrpF
MTQLRIPAVYMRGGTSKGVFFRAEDLPADPAERDHVLLAIESITQGRMVQLLGDGNRMACDRR